MIEKIGISIIVLAGIVGVILMISSFVIRHTFISKCEILDSVPRIGQNIVMCVKPNSLIKVNRD